VPRVLVKVCGITNTGDALACVSAGADFIGLNFAAGPRKISQRQGKEISEAVFGRISLVGVFADQDLYQVREIAESCCLDYIQLHGYESPGYIDALRGFRIIKAIRSNVSLKEALGIARLENVAYLLVDAHRKGMLGGTGLTANWEYAAALGKAMSELGMRKQGDDFTGLAIAGGLGPHNVRQCIDAVGPDMVDINSAVEIEPGRKDIQKVAAAIREVRLARAH